MYRPAALSQAHVESLDQLRALLNAVRERREEIETVGELKRAFRMFALEPTVMRLLDLRVSQIAERLSLAD